jgi:hypothetical protein
LSANYYNANIGVTTNSSAETAAPGLRFFKAYVNGSGVPQVPVAGQRLTTFAIQSHRGQTSNLYDFYNATNGAFFLQVQVDSVGATGAVSTITALYAKPLPATQAAPTGVQFLYGRGTGDVYLPFYSPSRDDPGTGAVFLSVDASNRMTAHPVSELGGGTVTSVGLTMPSGFSVGSSPVTTSGTISVTTSLNGPLRGNGSGFTTGNINLASEVTGTLPITNGGTGLTALGTALQQLRVNAGATALEYFTPAADVNIYNTSSSLTGNRVVSTGANSLTIDQTSAAGYFETTGLGAMQAAFYTDSIDLITPGAEIRLKNGSSAGLLINLESNSAKIADNRATASGIEYASSAYGADFTDTTIIHRAYAAQMISDSLATIPAAPEQAGYTWTARAAAEANQWQSVAYGNGLFVAVSQFGTNRVMASEDGINWTVRTAAEANQWFSVTYGNGLFVAVSNDGTNRVMTSPDGITWTARAAAEANAWQAVTYANGLFVAVSNTGTNRVMTSPDGITWTARAAAAANQWLGICGRPGLFVAVSQSGTGVQRVMTSPDGITWTIRNAAESNSWRSVTYGNGLFVAVSDDGTNRVMTSPDGITWTARAAAEANAWESVTYGNGLFVAVSDSGTNRVMTSGKQWAIIR